MSVAGAMIVARSEAGKTGHQRANDAQLPPIRVMERGVQRGAVLLPASSSASHSAIGSNRRRNPQSASLLTGVFVVLALKVSCEYLLNKIFLESNSILQVKESTIKRMKKAVTRRAAKDAFVIQA
jgi:hypothetical protein